MTSRPSARFSARPRPGAGLLSQLPDGTPRRVAQLDSRRDQAVAHPVGELEGARGAQLASKGDEVLDQRSQELARVAKTARGGLAQPLNQRV